MKILVKTANNRYGPEEYVNRDNADEIIAGSDYKDYDEYFVFDVMSIDEVIEKLDYDRFVVNQNPRRDSVNISITIYDGYIE